MGHLCGSVVVQRRVICHHAAKQRHVRRGSRFQGFLVLLFVLAAFYSQLCQCLCLCRTHEKQRFCALVITLDACICNDLLGQFEGILVRSKGFDLLCHQIGALLGAVTGLNCIAHFLSEHHAHGVLPRLRGHPGTDGPAIDSGLGAAGVVAVDAAGRHGLQNMKINIQTFGIHLNSPFRSL